MFHRIVLNPSHYGVGVSTGDDCAVEKYFKNWAKLNINRIGNLGLIASKDHKLFEVTDLGRIVSRHSISLKTFDFLLSLLKQKVNLEVLLFKICGVGEFFQRLTVRLADLSELKSKIRFPITSQVEDEASIRFCLAQLQFSSISLPSFMFKHVEYIIIQGLRIAQCLQDLSQFLCNSNSEKSLKFTKVELSFQTTLSIIQLSKSFRTRQWCDSIDFTELIDINFEERSLSSFDESIEANIKSIIPLRIELNILNIRNLFDINSTINYNSRFFILMLGCQQCDQLIYLKRISLEYLLSVDVFSFKAVIIQTMFEWTSTLDSPSKNSKQFNNDFREFCNHIDSFDQSIDNEYIAYHCSHSSQYKHNLKALITSEDIASNQSFLEFEVVFEVPTVEVQVETLSTPPVQTSQNSKRKSPEFNHEDTNLELPPFDIDKVSVYSVKRLFALETNNQTNKIKKISIEWNCNYEPLRNVNGNLALKRFLREPVDDDSFFSKKGEYQVAQILAEVIVEGHTYYLVNWDIQTSTRDQLWKFRNAITEYINDNVDCVEDFAKMTKEVFLRKLDTLLPTIIN